MIIPLEKLVEYKGNKYELAKAMIKLAQNGKVLMYNEAKLNNGKYIPIVIKNIMEGKIKFDYKDDHDISKEAPFLGKKEEEEYDESLFASAADEEDEEDEEDYDDFDEEDEEVEVEETEEDED